MESYQNEIKQLSTDLGATFSYNPRAEPIGEGRYKKVYSTEAVIGHEKLDAVYCLFNANLQNLQDIENEENLWKKVKENTGLVRYLGAHKDKNCENVQKIFLVFEKYNGGTLKDISASSLKPMEIKKIVGDLFLGLKALHSQEIVHLDLKPDNILLQKREDGQIIGAAITDLGLSREISGNKKVYPKNLFNTYAAPEYKKYFRGLLKELNQIEKMSNKEIEVFEEQRKSVQKTVSIEEKNSRCLSSKSKNWVDEFSSHDKLLSRPLGKESFPYDIYSLGLIISNLLNKKGSLEVRTLTGDMICHKNRKRANIDLCLKRFQQLPEESFILNEVKNPNRKRKFVSETGYYISESAVNSEQNGYDNEFIFSSSKKFRTQGENNETN